MALWDTKSSLVSRYRHIYCCRFQGMAGSRFHWNAAMYLTYFTAWHNNNTVMIFSANRTSNFTDRIKNILVTEINVLCWYDKTNNLVQPASKFAAHTLITWNNSDQTERGKSSLLLLSCLFKKKNYRKYYIYTHIYNRW